MDLRVGHDIDVWFDETGRLSLTDERRGGGDNSFGTGNVHGLEEEPSATQRIRIERGKEGERARQRTNA